MSADVVNVPSTPISITDVVLDVDFTIPFIPEPLAGCLTYCPAVTLSALGNVRTTSVTAVKIFPETFTEALGAVVEVCRPALVKYTIPCVAKSPD
jgi:hypothetical protein